MVSVSLHDPTTLPDADAVVVGVVPGNTGPRLARGAKPVEALMGRTLLAALRTLGATGKPDEVLKVPTLGLAPFPLVVATGLGADARSALMAHGFDGYVAKPIVPAALGRAIEAATLARR